MNKDQQHKAMALEVEMDEILALWRKLKREEISLEEFNEIMELNYGRAVN